MREQSVGHVWAITGTSDMLARLLGSWPAQRTIQLPSKRCKSILFHAQHLKSPSCAGVMVVVAASLSRQISLSSPLLPPAVSPWWRVWTLYSHCPHTAQPSSSLLFSYNEPYWVSRERGATCRGWCLVSSSGGGCGSSISPETPARGVAMSAGGHQSCGWCGDGAAPRHPDVMFQFDVVVPRDQVRDTWHRWHGVTRHTSHHQNQHLSIILCGAHSEKLSDMIPIGGSDRRYVDITSLLKNIKSSSSFLWK